MNYRIHTDAIKAHIIPSAITPAQASAVYASEADVLNVALFGQTAKQWRDANLKLEGNLREYASVEQLLVLANIESMNTSSFIWDCPNPNVSNGSMGSRSGKYRFLLLMLRCTGWIPIRKR